MKTQAWATTDVGLKRDHNEDSYLCNRAIELYAVADGMGGHLGGERASRLAVEILERELEPKAGTLHVDSSGSERLRHTQPGLGPPCPGPADASESVPAESVEWDAHPKTDPTQTPPAELHVRALHPAALAMRDAIRKAASAIYMEAQGQPERTGMGTTLTAAFFHGHEVSICHVGDSRAYLYRNGRVRQLTEDHSWIQEQIRAGLIDPEDAMVSRFRNIITRSVGFEPTVEPDLMTLPIESGDCLLLCSDGLSNYMTESEIGGVLGSRSPEEAGLALVEVANERGGDDNITCVLVKVPPGELVDLDQTRTDPVG
jgi:serine/threonine protein phosphatase PrpC